MFLIIITVISIIIAMIRKGSFSNLLDNGIKAWYLFAASVLIFLLLKIGDTLGMSLVRNYAKFFLLAAYALLLVGTAFNLSNLWMYPLLVGAVLNFIVIFINEGKMPISSTAIKIAGLSATSVEASAMTSVANASTSLTFLSGIIPIPLPSVLADVISPGTLLISVGLFFIIQNVLLGIVYEYDDDDYYDADDYDYEQRVYDDDPSGSIDDSKQIKENASLSKNTLPMQEQESVADQDEGDYDEDIDYTEDVFSFEEFDQSESLPEIDALLAAENESEQVTAPDLLIDEESETDVAPTESDDDTPDTEEAVFEPEIAEEDAHENEESPSIEYIAESSDLDVSEEDFNMLFSFDDDLGAEETEPVAEVEEAEDSEEEISEYGSNEPEEQIREESVSEEECEIGIEEAEDVSFEDLSFDDLFKDETSVVEEIFGDNETESEDAATDEPYISESEVSDEVGDIDKTEATPSLEVLDNVKEEMSQVEEVVVKAEISDDEIRTVSELSGKDYTSDEFAEYDEAAAGNAEKTNSSEDVHLEEEIDIDSPFIIIDGKIVENPNYKFRKGVGSQNQVTRDWSKGVVHENEQTLYTPPVQEKKVVEISNNSAPEVSSDGFEKVEMKIGDVQIKFWKREND